MSLWTPDGERPIQQGDQSPEPAQSGATTQPTDAAASSGDLAPEVREALLQAGVDVDQLTPQQKAEAAAMMDEMSQVRKQLLEAPASDVVANHLMGFYELGAIHLGENPPNFDEASVAIEALRSVLNSLEGKFGENEQVLKQALSQLQTTFVQLKDAVESQTSGDDE